ncbi:5656_t:CDS:2, partial [Funneliformis caledonium]
SPKWASGNSKIDEFIRYTQLNTDDDMNNLEWIDFQQFESVESINQRGAFSTTSSAVWREGPRWKLDEKPKDGGALADCFGMTKDPTSCYIFVMKYYENGNLYSYLDEFMEVRPLKGIRPTAAQLYDLLGSWSDPNKSEPFDQDVITGSRQQIDPRAYYTSRLLHFPEESSIWMVIPVIILKIKGSDRKHIRPEKDFDY